jgi:hypothetical protein
MPIPQASRPKADPTPKKRPIRRLNSGPTHSRDLLVRWSVEGDPARAAGCARHRTPQLATAPPSSPPHPWNSEGSPRLASIPAPSADWPPSPEPRPLRLGLNACTLPKQ